MRGRVPTFTAYPFRPMLFLPETRLQLAPNQASSVLGEETILINYEVGNYYELNEVGGTVWAFLQDNKPHSVADIEAHLLADFEVDPAHCRADLQAFLTELFDEKLIQLVS